jgi:hypothetical protein
VSQPTPAGELAGLEKTFKVISFCVWAVAVGVMIYGIPIVYELLTDHGVPPKIAWLLSPLVDAALCVGLVATPVLAKYGLKAGPVGLLRWVAGAATWGLQCTGSLIAKDPVGIFTHSVGPLILFVVVEAASDFQTKMAAKIRELKAAADQAEAKRRSDRAEIADLRQRLATMTSDRDTHLRRAEQLAAEATSGATSAESEIASIRLRLEQSEAAAETARDALRTTTENLRREHAEALRLLRAEHSVKLAEVRAEAKTVKLSDYRKPNGGATGGTVGGANGGRGKGTPKATRLSDSEAVDALLSAHSEADYEWAKAEVQRVTGCGWDRIPKLLELLSEAHLRNASDGTSETTSDAEATA